MTKGVYIAAVEEHSGKSLIVLGLMDAILNYLPKVGYFKPIITIDAKQEKDPHIQLILKRFNMSISYEEAYGFSGKEVADHSTNKSDIVVIDTLIEKYKKMEDQYDFTIVEGTDYMGKGAIFEFDANILIPKNLGIPVIMVVSAENKTVEDVAKFTLAAYEGFKNGNVEVLAVMINRTQEDQLQEMASSILNFLPQTTILSVIPESGKLNSPTFREVHDSLGAKALFGISRHDNPVDHTIVGAMQLHHFLDHIKDNTLIVTPGDRSDIIIGALQANLSWHYPRLAGIMLTGGFEPEPAVSKLIEGLQTVAPISVVSMGTYDAANQVGSIRSEIYADNTRKVELAIRTFEEHVDLKALGERLTTFKHKGMTPHMFQYEIVKRARCQKRHIVLPEGNDDRVLTAAARLIEQDIVELTIFGYSNEILSAAKRLGIRLTADNVHIIQPTDSDLYPEFVDTLYELRKGKNVTREMARDLMTDGSYFGTMMVYKGIADGMVSGAINTTQHTIIPALQFVKTKPGIAIVSSVFFMCMADRVLVFGDCAVNPDPTSENLADIAISSAESASFFGIEPKIAMLSYSSGASGVGDDVEKVRKATELVKLRRPDLKIAGPIQYDAAVDPAVGAQKMPGSDVAGQASVLIFPDLNTGNNTYKAVQRETGAVAIGPMLQGLNKPVNDLSRGCTVGDIFNTVVITAIQSQTI
ncbi:MAG: phosphate acetyltransferase [Syntrophales bacterium]|jgi:phosphate acetyltransferase|nr:phosphate acetyltransferase [Syntrophales bacterium]MCK9390899.1 phosphate acetyltransferase [Syntrophales bacterium]